jgi:hypothetical protein
VNRVTPNGWVEFPRKNLATVLTTACAQMSPEFPLSGVVLDAVICADSSLHAE